MARSLTRRSLFIGAVGAATVAALPTLPACSGGERSGGGRLRVAFGAGGSEETLDPHQGSLFVDQARSKALFDTLVAYDDDMSVRPRLAQEWESDAKGLRWRITLREARFHDGSPVTADDVLYSLRRVADPALASPSRQYFATVDFAASRAVSRREVELVLGKPDFEFPVGWGAPMTEIVPAGAKDFTEPIGSGPFRYVSFQPGRPAVFRSFDDHWSGPPSVAELEFVPLNEEAARLNALLSGQVDYAHDLAVESAKRVAGRDGVSVLAADRTTMQAVVLRVNRGPFADPRLVRAVLAGVDRESLVRVALSGRGEIGNDLFGKGLRGYASGIAQRKRDIDLARSLVREAGAEGLAFPLETSAVDPSFEAAATLLSQQLAEIGLRVTPNTRSASTYFNEIQTKGVAAHTRTATLPVATFLNQRFRTGASQNINGFGDPRFDTLMDRVAATRDESIRLDLLSQAQEITHDRGGLLVWGFSDWLIGVTDRVRGLRAAPPNSFGWARFEQVTLDED